MNRDYIHVPFTLTSKLILFSVALNGQEESFIFDSGAPYLVLNKKYEDMGDTESSTTIKGATGEASGIQTTSVACLDIEDLQLCDQTALIIDLSHLEAQLNTKIRGLIGYDSIKDYDVLYDYENTMVTLINPTKTADYIKRDFINQPLLFGNATHLPVLPICIAEKTFQMAIDCGAETSLLNSNHKEFICQSGVFTQKESQSLTGIENEVSQVQVGVIKAVSIGDEIQMREMPLLFSDISHLCAASNIRIDGIVGYDVLSAQKTVISYSRREMLFVQ